MDRGEVVNSIDILGRTLEAWARCSREERDWALLLWGLEGILTTGRGFSSMPLSLTALMWTKNERYFPPAIPARRQKGNSEEVLFNSTLYVLPSLIRIAYDALHNPKPKVFRAHLCRQVGGTTEECMFLSHPLRVSPLTSLGLVKLNIPAWPERSRPLANHTGPQRMSSLWSSRKGQSLEPSRRNIKKSSH